MFLKSVGGSRAAYNKVATHPRWIEKVTTGLIFLRRYKHIFLKYALSPAFDLKSRVDARTKYLDHIRECQDAREVVVQIKDAAPRSRHLTKLSFGEKVLQLYMQQQPPRR